MRDIGMPAAIQSPTASSSAGIPGSPDHVVAQTFSTGNPSSCVTKSYAKAIASCLK